MTERFEEPVQEDLRFPLLVAVEVLAAVAHELSEASLESRRLNGRRHAAYGPTHDGSGDGIFRAAS